LSLRNWRSSAVTSFHPGRKRERARGSNSKTRERRSCLMIQSLNKRKRKNRKIRKITAKNKRIKCSKTSLIRLLSTKKMPPNLA